MNTSTRIAIAAGGALLTAGASLFAISQTVNPVNSGLNMGTANVCPSGQNAPAPCSQTATVTFKFTSGGTIGVPAVLTMGATNLDFTDAGTGTCTTNGTSHIYSTNDTCTVDVKSAPMYPGQRNGAAVLLDNSGNLLATGYVQGTGMGPLVTFANKASGIFLSSKQSTLGSGLNGPVGAAMDGSGNVFVADRSSNSVKEILVAGGYITVKTLGSGFNSPNGVAVDGAGNLFVGDSGNHAVKEIVAAGGYTTIKTRGSGFNTPTNMSVDGSGNVFVADWNNSAVYEILAAGGYTTVKTLGSGFFEPDDAAVDGNGNVFVSDFGHNAVKEILAVGGYTTVKTLGSGFAGPAAVVADARGNIYVADQSHSAVKEIMAAGGYATVKTLGTGFRGPAGIVVDGSGNVFVANNGSSTVVKLDYADPPSLSFATTAGGSTSTDSPQVVNIANIGNQDLDILTLSYAADFPEAPGFSSDCTTSTSLAAGDSCTLSIDFSPLITSATGPSTPLSETISLTDNNLNSSAVEQSVAVHGTTTLTVGAPALTSPNPGSTLSGSSVTFNWSAGTGPTAYLLKVGTKGAGSSNIYLGGSTTSLSALVSGIPANGAQLYVQLDYEVGGTWTPINYTYTESIVTPPAITTPAPGSTLAGSGLTFNWSAGAGASAYLLKVGTAAGSSNVYLGSSTTSLSALVSGIPTNGSTLYVRLMYQVGATWKAIDYTCFEASAAGQPVITSPVPGNTLASSSATFNWSAGTGATSYQLKVGTTGIGSSNLFSSGTTTSLSAPVSGIPTHGATLYVRLMYKVGATWSGINYIYTEAGSPTPPVMSTPAPGSTLSGSGVTFNWSAGAGPSAYQLKVGTTGIGSSDVYLGGATTSLSIPVSGLPTNGQPVYVRLDYKVNGAWHAIDYTYTAQ